MNGKNHILRAVVDGKLLRQVFNSFETFTGYVYLDIYRNRLWFKKVDEAYLGAVYVTLPACACEQFQAQQAEVAFDVSNFTNFYVN